MLKIYIQKVLVLLMAVSLSMSAYGQKDTVFSTWKTIDDNSGEAKSKVNIYQKDNRLFGIITALLDAEDDVVCSECKTDDDRYNKTVLGMEIIRNLTWSDRKQVWEKGKVLDPENGKEYNCKIWIDKAGNLKLRGYIGPLFRTQTWYPAN